VTALGVSRRSQALNDVTLSEASGTALSKDSTGQGAAYR